MKNKNPLNLKHDLVPQHYKGSPKFITYINMNSKPVAVYEHTDKKIVELYRLKKYLLIYIENGKYVTSQENKINFKECSIGKDKKKKRIGTGILSRKNKRTGKTSKKSTKRKSKSK